MNFLRHVIAPVHPVVRTVPFLLRRPVFKCIVYRPELNFVYFRVPKAANSTVMLSLFNVINPGLLDPRGSSAKRASVSSLKLPLIIESRLDRCYKFTFVRNPYSRVLSAYLDRIAPGTFKYRKQLDVDNRKISFLEFLERLGDGYLTANIHWAPQSYIVTRPPSALDFVGRVENLERDLRQVLNQIFGAGDYEIVNRTEGVTSASSRIEEMYGDKERELVRKMYARDFELFYPEL